MQFLQSSTEIIKYSLQKNIQDETKFAVWKWSLCFLVFVVVVVVVHLFLFMLFALFCFWLFLFFPFKDFYSHPLNITICDSDACDFYLLIKSFWQLQWHWWLRRNMQITSNPSKVLQHLSQKSLKSLTKLPTSKKYFKLPRCDHCSDREQKFHSVLFPPHLTWQVFVSKTSIYFIIINCFLIVRLHDVQLCPWAFLQSKFFSNI